MRLAHLIPMSLAVALATAGCSSTGQGCRVTVANMGDQPITDVAVQAAGLTLYAAPSVAPKSAGAYQARRGRVASISVVTWKTSDGNAFQKTVKADKPMPDPFYGRLFYQIDATNGVKAFVIRDPDDGSADMPWAKPEKWEGSPAIPGLMRE